MNNAEAGLDKQRCQQAYELRHQGHTYKQVGLALNISEDYARQMVQVNDIIQQRQAMWTDGLSPRTASAIRYAGFTSRQEVKDAFQQQFEKIKNCIGLGSVGIRELRNWAGVANQVN